MLFRSIIMNRIITNNISSIESLFKLGEKIKDEEIQGHFAKYLCIKTSGLLENYVKATIGDYVDNSSSKPTANYVKSKMKAFASIDYQKLTNFLGSFNQDWKNDFCEKMDDKLKSSLNSLISNRNNIAHGIPDAITFNIIKEHYEATKNVIRILDNIIKK